MTYDSFSVWTAEILFSQLITALYNEGDSVKALKALDYCVKMIPGTRVRHDYVSTSLAEVYYKVGETQKGDAIMESVARYSEENLAWSKPSASYE